MYCGESISFDLISLKGCASFNVKYEYSNTNFDGHISVYTQLSSNVISYSLG